MAGSAEWRLLVSGPRDGKFNMALDQAILESVAAGKAPPTFRLYRWLPATVTLGYGQPVAGQVNRTACRRFGFELVRRCTGGRAVLHDREVTYAVVAPEGTIFGSRVLDNYRLIAEALQQALAEFGLQTSLQSGRLRGRGDGAHDQSVCFAVPAQYELLHQGCKMAGSAQRRWRGAFLQHGSIPVDLDLEKLYLVLHPDSHCVDAGGIERLANRVGWINRWQSKPVSVDQVEKAVVSAFARRFALDWVETGLTDAEKRRTEELQASHYRLLDWADRGPLFAEPA